MSDDNVIEGTPPAVDESTADPAPEQDSDVQAEPVDGEQSEESGNAEAAKYRKKARELKAERDALAARLEAVQRQQIAAMLDKASVKEDALWAVSDLPSLIGEDGTVNADAVQAAITTARERLGISPIGVGVHVPGIGSRPDLSKVNTDSWRDAFKAK